MTLYIGHLILTKWLISVVFRTKAKPICRFLAMLKLARLESFGIFGFVTPRPRYGPMCGWAHQLEFGDSSNEPKAHKIVVAMLTWTNPTTHKQTTNTTQSFEFTSWRFCWAFTRPEIWEFVVVLAILLEKWSKTFFWGPTLLVTKTSRLFNLWLQRPRVSTTYPNP